MMKGKKIMRKIKDRILEIFKDESGMGVIEVVLIIVILVGLALVFKTQITSIANGLYSSIKNQVNKF